MRRVNQHPRWCARGRLCGAHRRDGEHRSHPVRIDTPGCRLLATRMQSAGGRTRVELQAVVDIPPDADQTRKSAGEAFREALDDTTWGEDG